MDDRQVLLGRIVGVFGVEGWVKIHSFTEPRENILRYKPWCLRHGGTERSIAAPRGKVQGKGMVAQIPGVSDRDQAAALTGAEIWIARTQLPQAEEGSYYWTDLEGLAVVTAEGVELGAVSHLFATGANDVIVVKGTRERLIPYLPGAVVKEVDLAARRIVVDWDPEF